LNPRIRHLEWIGGRSGSLRILDQRALPAREIRNDRTTLEEVFEDIRTLAVRGAPAIGVAAAFGLVLGVRDAGAHGPEAFRRHVARAADRLRASRPTAVNLFWALDRMQAVAEREGTPSELLAGLLDEARAIQQEDLETGKRIGEAGAPLVPEGGGVLTHCNAGGLATSGLGTALAVVYEAHRRGKRFTVYADETRPLLQGARLTAWELGKAGIDHVLLCDGAAGSLMQAGRVGMVVVGADRIAAGGDVANKVGTYPLAVLAREHGVPFYVAAPSSTFDLTLASGADIPIEQRGPEEVRCLAGVPCAPEDTPVYNPAFDVTPAGLVTALITDKGVIEQPDEEKIRRALAK